MFLTASALAVLAANAPQPEPAPISLFQDETTAAEEAKWEGAFTAGLSLTDGNTDIQKASAAVDATKADGLDRYTLGFSWNFSEENGNVTQRKTYGKAQFDRFFDESKKTYWLVQASGEADDAAGVDLRTTAGAGVGYQFADEAKWKAAGEAGLSYFNEDLTGGMTNDYIAARLAYNWAYLLSDRWAFEQVGEIFPSLEESDDIYTKIDTRAKATLTENMFAQAQWVWDWDNTPAAGNERSDHLFLLTVGWSF